MVLAFAGNFDSDTINVKYNGIDTTLLMSTNEKVGFAGDLVLGKIKETYLTLKINNYKPVRIRINKQNQIFLIEKFDSLLLVRSRYYLPGFM